MAAHRYWRLTILRTSSTYCEINELELRTTPGGASVATSGTATASSQYSGGTGPANAFDGNGSTYWESASIPAAGDQANSYGSWLKYDFGVGVAHDIVEAAMTVSAFMTEAPLSFMFEYSDDDATWFPAGKFNASGWVAATPKLYALGVPVPTGARYWRIYCTALQTGGVQYLTNNTIQLNESVGGPDVTPGALATSPNNYFSGPVYRCFDDDDLSPGSVGPTTTPWILDIDHRSGYGYKCDELVIKNSSGSPHESAKDFELQYSSDGVTWFVALSRVAEPTWVGGETRTYATTDNGSGGGPPPGPSTRRRPVIIAGA